MTEKKKRLSIAAYNALSSLGQLLARPASPDEVDADGWIRRFVSTPYPTLNKLQAAGLLEWQWGPGAYNKHVRLTPKGEEMAGITTCPDCGGKRILGRVRHVCQPQETGDQPS